MTKEYLKDISDEISKGVSIRVSKTIQMSEDEYEKFKQAVKAEILLAFSGEVSTE